LRPLARGRGVGAALMQECVRRVRKTGGRVLSLHTTDMMQAALRMYERMGFVRAPELDFHPAPGVTVRAIVSISKNRGDTMKILIKSVWGSSDPTQASFPFHHANAFAEAGHQVQIFLLGEAVFLMRTVVANAVVPVGWAPLSEALAKVIEHRVPIHV
jgi:hypothetical protein